MSSPEEFVSEKQSFIDAFRISSVISYEVSQGNWPVQADIYTGTVKVSQRLTQRKDISFQEKVDIASALDSTGNLGEKDFFSILHDSSKECHTNGGQEGKTLLIKIQQNAEESVIVYSQDGVQEQTYTRCSSCRGIGGHLDTCGLTHHVSERPFFETHIH